jgi:subtilase family serine protease
MTNNFRKFAVYAGVFSLFLLLFSTISFRHFGLSSASGQSSSAEPMIQQSVNNNLRVVLRGNTYPLARAEFDQGPAADDTPINHRFLVLRRPQAQQDALDKFMAEQQDPSSANYHHWLTPQQYGQQYGPAQSDIDTATAWLTSNGFTSIHVANGRDFIDFSGTAAQFNHAFQTSIHNYSVKGKVYWANSSDPTIPAALAPLVVGVNAMHNFPRHPAYHVIPKTSLVPAKGIHRAYSYPSGCNTDVTSSELCSFALSPGDFGTIYNVLPLWDAGTDGSGVTIAVIGQSNIQLTDVSTFRTIFGLAPKAPVVTIVDGEDPGLGSPDEGESALDVEWSGAIAPDATINLVTTSVDNGGVDTSANYAVDNDVAPIVSESYDQCEFNMGTSGNAEYNALWQKAAGLGITVLLATGDNGATACDFYNSNEPTTPQPAEDGLQVSGLASTPYDVAVGGTDFDQFLNPGNYWSTTNTTVGSLTEVSANRYIPETTWNVSCTNFIFGLAGYSADEETNCNDTSQLIGESDGETFNYILTGGGGGGLSNCTTSGQTITSCSGGYALPSWQVGPGVPTTGHRAIPDVSMFAGNGFNYSFYVVCQQDATDNEPCNLAEEDFVGVGGTSAAAQVFAGVMALVVQKYGNQGNPNPTFYKLAQTEKLSSCNSSNSAASSCIFYDITNGTIAQPCAKGSLNCTVTNGADSIGVTSGYSSLPGYDFATGLGSVNAANLVNNWHNTTNNGSADYAVSLNPNQITADASGDTGTASLCLLSTNGYTGTINLAGGDVSGLPQYSSASFSPSSISLSAAQSACSTLSISTASTSRLLPIDRNRPLAPAPLLLFFGALFTALLLFAASRKQIRWSTAFGAFALGLLLACGACGGGGGGNTPPPANSTPEGLYTGIVINVSDGTTTHTVPLVLNVN